MDIEEVQKIYWLLIMQVSCVASKLRPVPHEVSHGTRWKNGYRGDYLRCSPSTLEGNLCLGRQILDRAANSTTTWYGISCPQFYQGKLQTQVSFRTSTREWVCGIDGCLHCFVKRGRWEHSDRLWPHWNNLRKCSLETFVSSRDVVVGHVLGTYDDRKHFGGSERLQVYFLYLTGSQSVSLPQIIV